MEKLIATRTLMGKLSFLALVIALLGVGDGLLASWRTPKNQCDMITGHSAEIIGKFYGTSTNPGDLGYVSCSKGVMVHFDTRAFKGFWLGENMWRGNILISSDQKEGTYPIRITFKDLSNIKPKDRPKLDKLLTYSVRVFENAESMRKHELSAVKRYLGILPWYLSIFSLPVILVTVLIGFLLSVKIERGMAERGKAEVYRVSKNDDQLEIHFGLGKNHGLSIGERLMLFNKAGILVTDIFVRTLDSDDASALAESSLRITPGCLVSRI